MRTHLASATLVGIALLVAGCGGHTASREFGALPTSPGQVQAAPPVVVAEPAPNKEMPATTHVATPAAGATAAELAKTKRAEKRLRHQKLLARQRLGVERVARAWDRRRAAAREQRLREELAAAKIAAPKPAHAAPHRTHSAPLHASDVATDENARAARVTVVRFHDLLNAHDADACSLLSVRFLHDHFAGADADAQRASCRNGVQSLNSPVSVLIESSGSDASGAWAKVVSRFGDTQRPQIIHLVRFFNAWMIDSVEPVPSR